MDWPTILGKLASGTDLSRDEARAAMSEVMGGTATPAQISALIVSLRMKGETVDEMTGLVEAIKSAAVPVPVDADGLVDVVGTGGDRSGTFNISTTAALIAAGAGVRVAKHGNRSASSKCGSADVLEGLGVTIDLPVEANLALLADTGFAFFFAPLYHPSFRHAGPVRRELGIATVFNFLGPLANPAGARRQAVGVSDRRMAERVIGVLASLGSEYSFVFSGDGGVDEITTSGPTVIYRLDGWRDHSRRVHPGGFRGRTVRPERDPGRRGRGERGDSAWGARWKTRSLSGRSPRSTLRRLWWLRAWPRDSSRRSNSPVERSTPGPLRRCSTGSSLAAAT